MNEADRVKADKFTRVILTCRVAGGRGDVRATGRAAWIRDFLFVADEQVH